MKTIRLILVLLLTSFIVIGAQRKVQTPITVIGPDRKAYAVLDPDEYGWGEFWCLAYGIKHRDKTIDSDGDGLTDYEEMLFGTDPWKKNGIPKEPTVADLIEAERRATAIRAAQEQEWAKKRAELAPLVHEGLKAADGTPALSVQSLMDESAMRFSTNAEAKIKSEEAARAEAELWAKQKGNPLVNGSPAHLVGREGGVPRFLAPFDLGAAITISTTNVWPGGPTGFNLNGTNRVISMWDEASPRLTHVEFQSRVTRLDTNTNLNDHSTAVAGVIAAGGVTSLLSNGVSIGFAAKGMAFAAQVQARDFNSDTGEMTGAVGTNQMRLSNHSYGTIQGWYFYTGDSNWYWLGNAEISTNQDPKFGNYTSYTSNYDAITQNAPTYLGVWAAGNSQSNGPTSQPIFHGEFDLAGNVYGTTAVRPLDGDAGGFDSLSQEACAKNTLVVGAIYPLTNGFVSPTNVVLAPFSSCGPTDDGRIKPDVVAQGINNVVAIADGSDSAYSYMNGTSFAAPSVAGSVGLLAQFFKQLHTNASDPLASTLKGLVLHTADSCTTNKGPSYRFGWGVMNTRSAASVLSADATNGLKNQIKEVLLTNGQNIQFPVVALDGGTNPLKVTICWTDPAGTANAATNLDNPAPKLVNDLDLRVISPSGVTNFPWILNPDLTNQTSAARSAAATTGDDSRNNVEQVYIAQPSNATYLVQVTHKCNLQSNGTQWVSIFVSGNVAQPAPPLFINSIVQTASNALTVGWPAVVGGLYRLQANLDLTTTNWTNVDGILSARLTNLLSEAPFSVTNTAKYYRAVLLP